MDKKNLTQVFLKDILLIRLFLSLNTFGGGLEDKRRFRNSYGKILLPVVLFLFIFVFSISLSMKSSPRSGEVCAADGKVICSTTSTTTKPPVPDYCYRRVGQPSVSEAKSIYGSTENEVIRQLVIIDSFGVNMQVHKLVAPCFQAAINEIRAKGIVDNYRVQNDGTFSWRGKVSNPSSLSMHAFGIAVDYNAAVNCWLCKNNDFPPGFVDTWKKYAFGWGGDWKSFKDPMHFQWEGRPN